MTSPAVESGEGDGDQPSCSTKASRYSGGTFESVFGQILLAMAEISLRIVATAVWSASNTPSTGSMADAHTSYSSHRSSSGLMPPVTLLPRSSSLGYETRKYCVLHSPAARVPMYRVASAAPPSWVSEKVPVSPVWTREG